MSCFAGSKEIDPGSRDKKQPRFVGGGPPHPPRLVEESNAFVGDEFTFLIFSDKTWIIIDGSYKNYNLNKTKYNTTTRDYIPFSDRT